MPLKQFQFNLNLRLSLFYKDFVCHLQFRIARIEKDWDLRKLTKVFKFLREILKNPRVLIWIGFLSNIHLMFSLWFICNMVAFESSATKVSFVNQLWPAYCNTVPLTLKKQRSNLKYRWSSSQCLHLSHLVFGEHILLYLVVPFPVCNISYHLVFL